MKGFERLILAYIKSVIPNTTDPYQFAYRENRSVDDAVCLALNSVYKHLDKRNTYARMLFIDYSSAVCGVREVVSSIPDRGNIVG